MFASSQTIKDLVLLHCGSETFDDNLFKDIENDCYWIKPNGGFWSSPIDSELSWKYWCKENCFRSTEINFSFKLKEDSNIIVIDDIETFNILPKLNSKSNFLKDIIDFEYLAKHSDGIWITKKGLYDCHRELYGYDVETVLIFNKEKIIV